MEGRRGGGSYSNSGHGGNGGGGGGYSNYGHGGGSAGRGRGRGRVRNQQDQNYQGGQYYHHDGSGRGGRGGGRGGNHHADGGYDNRSPVPADVAAGGRGGGESGRGTHHVGGGYNIRPPVPAGGGEPRQRSHYHQQQQQRGGSAGGGVGPTNVWTGRPWGPSVSATPSSSTGQQLQYQPRPQQHPKIPERTHQSISDPAQLNVELLRISEPKSISSGEKPDNKLVPMRRPGRGTLPVRTISLLANHFPVTFNPRSTIIRYDVGVRRVMSDGNQALKSSIPKALMHLIKEKLFDDESLNFPVNMVAYDGEKNIFSAVALPTGEFQVNLSNAEDARARTYIVTIKEVNQLSLSKLNDYLCENISYIPRDILQAMDLVMKENPSRNRITVGRGFYSKNYRERDDLGHGIAAYRGFHQGLKLTSQGLALCLDNSALAFRKPLPVLNFLLEFFELQSVDDITMMKNEVSDVLKGLKVRVTHHNTKQKYTISELTPQVTREVTFPFVDPDGQAPLRNIRIVDYFRQKYEKEITYLNIPCLELGNANKKNQVPMEFCVLVEGQRYPKEYLERNAASLLRKISLVSPAERKRTICGMVQAEDGPYGNVARNFEMKVERYMTIVEGRVLRAPELKLRDAKGNMCPVIVDQEKCHWNLVGKSVVEGKPVERWALIDFTSSSHCKLRTGEFINKLRQRSRKFGMPMEDPLTCHVTGMREFSSAAGIERLLRKVISDARQKSGSQGTHLQVIVCVMAEKDFGYNYLKWVSETKIGVVTQCCLSSSFHSDKAQDQFLENICRKINAKLGGSNVELNERLPHFVDEDYVMFIGADVNHPAPGNSTCPSIAAVVGTINWPSANQYAARIQPQEHRKEKIVNFGSICRDLVDSYAQRNKVRPRKIIVFRDGVSEGQFDMVLNEELLDLKQAICGDNYQPTITLVVAQKRHQTRLFLDGTGDGGVSGNVPPGTVVETKIVHPFEFDFYLYSHYGSIGTSKPTHYHVLWDENAFTSDELQKLIYNLCFTYARCTKPVSLVPPVYYADLVAYRGRLFQQVVMEQSHASSVSSSSSISSASSSSSAASFDPNFYTWHRDLLNVMCFV